MSDLIEPAVLADAKEFLVPSKAETGYAVVDSQFQVDHWGTHPIDGSIRSRLEPINSLQLSSGRPDALVAPPRSDTYRGSPDAVTALPMAVVEAKGVTDHSDRNTTRVAITQAHTHLGEANVSFAAVPEDHVTEEDRALARELNIGLLGVDTRGVELLERPRLVGTETTPTTETIRFHARLGGTAVESLKKNHPKNALGYALALQREGNTKSVFKDYVIDSVNDARLDAVALGLVTQGPDRTRLTPQGREAVRTIVSHHGGIEAALEAIDRLTGSSVRFIDTNPVMGTVARQTLLSYPPTQVLVDVLDEFAEEGVEVPSLSQVAKAVATDSPNFALDLFVSTRSEDRKRVLSDDDEEILDLEAFDDGTIYSTHTTYQYKAMLYHVGLLTERGNDTKSELDPKSATWALETPIESSE